MVLNYLILTMFKATYTTGFQRQDKQFFAYHLFILTDNLQRWESFIFFTISDLTQFRKDLDIFAPIITSSTQTARDLEKIHSQVEDLDIVSHGIAFSKAGLKKLDVLAKLGDSHFDQGSQVNEKKQLGDKAEYDAVFATDGKTHGVILVTARSKLVFVTF